MIKFVTLTATAALLSGAIASAETMDAQNDTSVETQAEMTATANSDIDEMTIEELNAWQLIQLTETAETVPYASSTAPVVYKSETVKDYTESETGTTLAEKVYADSETYASTSMPEMRKQDTSSEMMGMGGPEYMSEKDATSAYQVTATIVDAAESDARFTTLVSLLQKSGLDTALEQEGPYTVFAPTNTAFEKLDAEMLSNLTADTDESREKLKGILKAHVVEGRYTPASFTEASTTLETLSEAELMVEVQENGAVTASDVEIKSADIKTGNGVILVVDEVIVPEMETNLEKSVMTDF